MATQATKQICYDLMQSLNCLCFLECEREGLEIDIVKNLFSDHLLFVCLDLLNMLDFAEWRHTFVHISIQWPQRSGRGSPAEWG